MKNILMAISGPSGVGKGTVVKNILDRRDDMVASVSCTTRAPRTGENNGKDYIFITKEEFLKRIEDNDFLEYDEHFGNYYGTPKSFVEETLKTKSVILEIDVVGALKVKKEFPECVLVLVVPPSMEELKRRLTGRKTETEEEINNRLERIAYELSQKDKYDYIVTNDTLENAVNKICEIVDKEKF